MYSENADETLKDFYRRRQDEIDRLDKSIKAKEDQIERIRRSVVWGLVWLAVLFAIAAMQVWVWLK